MTGHRSTSSTSPRHVAGRSALARGAVMVAAAVAGVIATSFVIFGIAYLVGGGGAIDDTWVGLLVVVALLGGLFVSLVAFVIALAVVIRHERWAPLWLPLLLFPAIFSFLLLGELFWWE